MNELVTRNRGISVKKSRIITKNYFGGFNEEKTAYRHRRYFRNRWHSDSCLYCSKTCFGHKKNVQNTGYDGRDKKQRRQPTCHRQFV